MTTFQRHYCQTLNYLPLFAFLVVGIVNILAGTSTEWGFLPAWLWGGVL